MLGFAIAPVASNARRSTCSAPAPERAWGAVLLRFLFWTATLKPLCRASSSPGWPPTGWSTTPGRDGTATTCAPGGPPPHPSTWRRGRRGHGSALAAAFDAWHCWREPVPLDLRAGAAGPGPGLRPRRRLVRPRPDGRPAVAPGPRRRRHVLACDLPWSWGVPIWMPLAVAAVWPWSKHRRVRPVEVAVEESHPLEEEWAALVAVAPNAGPLTGSVLTHDPANARFRLTVPPTSPDGADKADDLACRLLRRPRGTVTISPDPDGLADDYLVAFTERTDGAVVRYWDGPTLTVSKNGLAEITPRRHRRAHPHRPRRPARRRRPRPRPRRVRARQGHPDADHLPGVVPVGQGVDGGRRLQG
jgi:hypothetical protein